MKKLLNQRANSLLGKWVKFRVGRRKYFGRVCSVEQQIANIRGFEQIRDKRPAYHYNIREIIECSHDEVFKLGRAAINLFK